jgi:hypothetical protein
MSTPVICVCALSVLVMGYEVWRSIKWERKRRKELLDLMRTPVPDDRSSILQFRRMHRRG